LFLDFQVDDHILLENTFKALRQMNDLEFILDVMQKLLKCQRLNYRLLYLWEEALVTSFKGWLQSEKSPAGLHDLISMATQHCRCEILMDLKSMFLNALENCKAVDHLKVVFGLFELHFLEAIEEFMSKSSTNQLIEYLDILIEFPEMQMEVSNVIFRILNDRHDYEDIFAAGKLNQLVEYLLASDAIESLLLFSLDSKKFEEARQLLEMYFVKSGIQGCFHDNVKDFFVGRLQRALPQEFAPK
jgi:hypothetical protein